MPSIKSFAAKLYAARIYNKINSWASNPIETQERVFKSLISDASSTQFGKDHNFKTISSYEDFVNNVPVRDYEALKPYIEKVVGGEEDILWKGRPLYFAKTSGTTSGAKYIPITKESMPSHIEAAKNAILLYIHQTGNTKIVTRKMIFLQGSPVLETKNGIQLGRLSGIVAHYVPKYLQKNRLPTWKTNCIEDWETKVNTIVHDVPLRLMYYFTILALSLKNESVKHPGLLIIDTPEDSGIDEDNLKKNLDLLNLAIEQGGNSKKEYQIILTTGLDKYPESFKKDIKDEFNESKGIFILKEKTAYNNGYK
jgi:hypothetical protein